MTSPLHKKARRGHVTGPRARGTSFIFRSAASYLLPLLLLFSVFVLMRGHDEPGGGFAGGLVASAAFALLSIAHGVEAAKRSLPLGPRAWIAIGLFLAGGSGLIAAVSGQRFLTAQWTSVPMPVMGDLGTPLLFDLGVYLTVIGTVLDIFLSLMED